MHECVYYMSVYNLKINMHQTVSNAFFSLDANSVSKASSQN